MAGSKGFRIYLSKSLRESITISAIDNRGKEVLAEEIFEDFGCHGFGSEGFVEKGNFVFPSREICRNAI